MLSREIAEAPGRSPDLVNSTADGRAQLERRFIVSGDIHLVFARGPGAMTGAAQCGMHSPTLTAVLPSSSENLLPACLLLMLIRLELRVGRMPGIMLIGRCLTPIAAGDPGGEVAILTSEALRERMVAIRGGTVVCCGCNCGYGRMKRRGRLESIIVFWRGRWRRLSSELSVVG
jgi:hypothetical protein